MENDSAVLDAPVLETEEAVVEPVLEDSAAEPEVAAEPVAEVKGDDRVIPKWLRNLKGTDPEGYKEAREKFFTLRNLDEKLKDFDLDGTKKFLEENGTPESILQTLQEREEKAQELDQINQAIAEGKAEILDRIPAESLAKLAPSVNQKWAQADPDGWAREMSGVMAATISNSGIPMFLERMGMLLEFGKNDDVKAAITQLQDWAGSFKKTASAPPPAKTEAKAPDVNAERQQWDNEKFQTKLRDDVEAVRTTEIARSLESYVARKPNDADAKEMATMMIRTQVVERLGKDQDFQTKLNGLVARKDREGAMRLIKSRETQAINDIAPKVGRTIFGQPPAVVAKPVVAAKPAIRTAVANPRDKFDAVWNA